LDWTVDSDVVAILVGNYNQFVDINPAAEVWVRYGTGNHIREVCNNTIHEAPQFSDSLVSRPSFGFSGCDTVSSFKGVSKKNSLKKSSEDDIEGLRQSGATPFQILEMTSPVFTTQHSKMSLFVHMEVRNPWRWCQRNEEETFLSKELLHRPPASFTGE